MPSPEEGCRPRSSGSDSGKPDRRCCKGKDLSSPDKPGPGLPAEAAANSYKSGPTRMDTMVRWYDEGMVVASVVVGRNSSVDSEAAVGSRDMTLHPLIGSSEKHELGCAIGWSSYRCVCVGRSKGVSSSDGPSARRAR